MCEHFPEHPLPRPANAPRRGVDPLEQFVRQAIEFNGDGYERPPDRARSEFFTSSSTSCCVIPDKRDATA